MIALIAFILRFQGPLPHISTESGQNLCQLVSDAGQFRANRQPDPIRFLAATEQMGIELAVPGPILDSDHVAHHQLEYRRSHHARCPQWRLLPIADRRSFPNLQYWYLIWTLLLGYLGFLMRNVVDIFHIKWEITIQFRIAILQIAFWLIPPVNDFHQNHYPILGLVYFAAIQVQWFNSIILPIRWSYQEMAAVQSSVTLQQILDQPAVLDAFQQFLITELCIENLYFLLAVRRLKKLARNPTTRSTISISRRQGEPRFILTNFRHELLKDNHMIQEMIQNIFNLFCVQSSAFAISISSEQRSNVELHLSDGDVEVFDGAQLEIERLLQQNCVSRFLTSELGRQS